jgi:hypothetical protein
MPLIALSLMLIALPALLLSQQTELPGARSVTATTGIGNAMSWIGAQAETYFARQRASAFAGVGYTPELDPGDPTGVTFAVGARGFTSGLKHRGFLELSVSQVAISTTVLPGEGERHYGPGLQLGYQFVSRVALRLWRPSG